MVWSCCKRCLQNSLDFVGFLFTIEAYTNLWCCNVDNNIDTQTHTNEYTKMCTHNIYTYNIQYIPAMHTYNKPYFSLRPSVQRKTPPNATSSPKMTKRVTTVYPSSAH